MEKKKATATMIVVIEKDTDGTFFAYNTEESSNFSAIGRGNTVPEAKEDFLNSIEEMKESMIEAGETIPAIMTEPPKFRLDLSSLFTYYSAINVTAFAKSIGINPSLMRQYRKNGAYVSDAQMQKIEDGLHNLGKELSALSIV